MLNFILGLIVGGVIVKILDSRFRGNDTNGKIVNSEQVERKKENLEKVIQMAREKGEITNDDVEHGLGVSNATAERYLNELEQEGELEQIGKTGRAVIYKLK